MSEATAPHKGASTEDWATYAKSKGFPEDQVKGLKRDEIIALVEATQDQVNPAEGDDTTPGDDAQTAAQEVTGTPGEPDFSKFTGGIPAAPAADPATVTETPVEETVPSGEPLIIDEGTSRAEVITGVFQLTDNHGFRHQARKGTVVSASPEKINRGVKLGFLKAL